MIRRLPHVDRIGIEERAAWLGKRSIKTSAKLQGIRLAVSMVDLTTLEGQDTAGKVRQLAAKAVCPAPTMPEIPSFAAVCVYPALVPVVARRARGHRRAHRRGVDRVPGGPDVAGHQAAGDEEAVAAGADEIDMVISREAFLAGDDARVMEEIVRVKEACGDAHLKVIIETAELRLLRPRPPRLDARHGGRRGLHQDLDRQGRQRRDARRHARDARGDPRLRRAHRPPRWA